jgi:phosphohistidine phosphatase SixA
VKILVMRHGAADDPDGLGDPYRVLTDDGRRTVREVMEAAKAAGHAPRAILVSPLTRAVQTAEIAAAFFGLRPRLHLALAPGATAARALGRVLPAEDTLLVSHEPTVSAVGTFLGDGHTRGFRTAEVRVYEVESPDMPGREVARYPG